MGQSAGGPSTVGVEMMASSDVEEVRDEGGGGEGRDMLFPLLATVGKISGECKIAVVERV